MAETTNYDVNVDFSGLENFAFAVSGLDESLAKVDAAGQEAIASVGGEETPAGTAMRDALVPINKAYFDQTINELHSLEADLKKLADAYADASSQLASNIRSISDGSSN